MNNKHDEPGLVHLSVCGAKPGSCVASLRCDQSYNKSVLEGDAQP